MSHRRAPPIECPLASLGHNLPSEHQYRHPLSSSPLNPNDYQMSSRKSPILNIGVDGLIQFSTLHETDDSNKSTEDVSHLGTAINLGDNNDYVNVYRNPMQCNFSTAEESDNISTYQSKNESKRDDSDRSSSPTVDILDIAHKRNDRLLMRSNRFKSAANGNSATLDCEPYYLENKMRSLIVHEAGTTEKNSTYPLAKNDRLYELQCEDSRMKSLSPRFFQRPSSPSETSESDRCLGERRSQGSPAKHQRNISRTSYNYLNNHPRAGSSASSSSNVLIDSLVATKRMGRFSPNFDQGYHTLNSPSVSALSTTAGNPPPAHRGRSKSDTVFSRLPDEVCIKIFSWLDSFSLCNVSKVCKRFDSLVWRPQLWKIISLKGKFNYSSKLWLFFIEILCFLQVNISMETEH